MIPKYRAFDRGVKAKALVNQLVNPFGADVDFKIYPGMGHRPDTDGTCPDGLWCPDDTRLGCPPSTVCVYHKMLQDFEAFVAESEAPAQLGR